jgi:hypothetical protein
MKAMRLMATSTRAHVDRGEADSAAVGGVVGVLAPRIRADNAGCPRVAA